MKATMIARSIIRGLAGGTILAAAGYAAYAGITWVRYGHVDQTGKAEEEDALLDRFMPVYEVVERHHVRVRAPAQITFETASEMDLEGPLLARAIFKARSWIMRSDHGAAPKKMKGFVAQLRGFGWGVLAETPGREIVMGGVTQPWHANPVFRALPPEEFVAFRDPNYVKIIFNLRVDACGAAESVFRTETRAVATDSSARSKFRRYWSFVSPGVSLIRWMSLSPLKAEAERRVRAPTTIASSRPYDPNSVSHRR